MKLVANPALPRQLEVPELLLFWRDGWAKGSREALLAQVRACPEPGCLCTELTLECQAFDDHLVSAELEASKLRVMQHGRYAGEPSVMPHSASVEVDFETGEVNEERTKGHRPLITWARRELDGELLDLLHGGWRALKGFSSEPPHVDIEGWSPGNDLAYGDVFPDSRDDAYVIDSRRYSSSEWLNPHPDCHCDEAEVLFFVSDPGPAESAGVVKLRASTGDVLSFRPEKGRDQRLHQLWDLYSKRHHVAARIATRSRQLKIIGPRLRPVGGLPITPPPAAPRPRGPAGRNDPCPCGSGLKFKRCCLGTAPKRLPDSGPA